MGHQRSAHSSPKALVPAGGDSRAVPLLSLPTSLLLPQHALAQPWHGVLAEPESVRSRPPGGCLGAPKGFPSLAQTGSVLKSKGLPCPLWDGRRAGLPSPRGAAAERCCHCHLRTDSGHGSALPARGQRGGCQVNPRDIPAPSAQQLTALASTLPARFNENGGGGNARGFSIHCSCAKAKPGGEGW